MHLRRPSYSLRTRPTSDNERTPLAFNPVVHLNAISLQYTETLGGNPARARQVVISITFVARVDIKYVMHHVASN
jgi:hypothetical protein